MRFCENEYRDLGGWCVLLAENSMNWFIWSVRETFHYSAKAYYISVGFSLTFVMAFRFFIFLCLFEGEKEVKSRIKELSRYRKSGIKKLNGKLHKMHSNSFIFSIKPIELLFKQKHEPCTARLYVILPSL